MNEIRPWWGCLASRRGDFSSLAGLARCFTQAASFSRGVFSFSASCVSKVWIQHIQQKRREIN